MDVIQNKLTPLTPWGQNCGFLLCPFSRLFVVCFRRIWQGASPLQVYLHFSANATIDPGSNSHRHRKEAWTLPISYTSGVDLFSLGIFAFGKHSILKHLPAEWLETELPCTYCAQVSERVPPLNI